MKFSPKLTSKMGRRLKNPLPVQLKSFHWQLFNRFLLREEAVARGFKSCNVTILNVQIQIRGSRSHLQILLQTLNHRDMELSIPSLESHPFLWGPFSASTLLGILYSLLLLWLYSFGGWFWLLLDLIHLIKNKPSNKL